MLNLLNILVLMGGPSAEREVSRRSGEAVAKALKRLGHRVETLDPEDANWQPPDSIDVVFIALHGTYGEDGAVQQRLEGLRLPYTGCDAASSQVAFDKVLTKQHCLNAGLVTAPFRVYRTCDPRWPQGWEPPLVLKPVRQGSSVGLQFIDRKEQWSEAIRSSLQHDSEVLLEQRIPGREVTVGILNQQVLPLVEVRPKKGGYDYSNKYTSGATDYLCPAPFPGAVARRIQEAGLAAFRAVQGRDYGRIDFIVKEDGTPVLLEVNTLPGMTETSLFPKAALQAGISFDELCQRMVDLAWQRAPKHQAV